MLKHLCVIAEIPGSSAATLPMMGKPTTPPENDFELSIHRNHREGESPDDGKDTIVTADAQHGVQAVEAVAAVWSKWDLVIAYGL